MAALRIDVWSDLACPWCFVGKRRLEAALQHFAQPVELVWHSFELDPNAPREPKGSHVELLSRKLGRSPAEAQQMLDRMTKLGQADGIDFQFANAKSTSTFDAHRLLHFASAHGKQDALKDRLFRAYFSEGVALSDRAALVRLAGEVGLDQAAARRVLENEEHALDVRADEEQAREIGIRGVPFFVFGGRLAISGAESAEVLGKAMAEAASAQKPVLLEEGATCGPDGC